MKRIYLSALGVTLLLVVAAFGWSTDAFGQRASRDNRYIGQPVVDDTNIAKADRDFRLIGNYKVERMLWGLRNPVAHALGADGTIYAAEVRQSGSGSRKFTTDIISIDTEGTVHTVRSGLSGAVKAMAYHNGYLYAAGGFTPEQIRRVSVRTGKFLTIFEGQKGARNAPRDLVDIVQNPKSEELDLYALDAEGSVWRLSSAEIKSKAYTSSAKSPSSPGSFFSRQGARIVLWISVILVVAIAAVNWFNKRKV